MYKVVKQDGGSVLPNGFYVDGVNAGLKANNALDMAFIYSESLCETAAVFTTNKMTAAPIRHFKSKGSFQTNFVLINSKNANAMTGRQGIADIDEILETLPFSGIINPIMSSTGVIGVRLPKEKIIDGIKKFDLSKKEPERASQAIMTTDKFAKRIAYEVTLSDDTKFTIWAMAKGAGMINPAMATMLSFILTDADVDQNEMQKMLDDAVETTFNAISVDGDTSTNDTVLLLSNKKSGVYDKDAFYEALVQVMQYLALEIVRDGEGAQKVVTYDITGAKNNKEAERAAKQLSNSLLVKTALYGEDPNWGRIASTIGASGITCDEELLSISFNDVTVYEKGEIHFDKEMEAKAANVMKLEKFTIYCDLGIANGSFRAYGCDLGYEYVKINADYRT
jgi:glutamate N-acetyltransferase / amino-acid N-acetyltransferase